MDRHNLVLVGFMGSGKSSIGRLLAAKLDFEFLDTDRLIVEQAGMTIPEIFATHGEAHFRDLETRALESLRPCQHCVIATGGGVVLRESNRALLRELGFVIGLSASEEVTFARVSRNSKRPLLQTANPRQTIREMLAARSSLYQEAAELNVDTSALTHQQVAESILTRARGEIMNYEL